MRRKSEKEKEKTLDQVKVTSRHRTSTTEKDKYEERISAIDKRSCFSLLNKKINDTYLMKII